jgi:ABC-2 type transport system permease protein
VSTAVCVAAVLAKAAALPFARYGLRGTVAARFWIYQRRDPGSLIYWGITAIVMMAVSVSTIRTAARMVWPTDRARA